MGTLTLVAINKLFSVLFLCDIIEQKYAIMLTFQRSLLSPSSGQSMNLQNNVNTAYTSHHQEKMIHIITSLK